ncbi:S1 family peptidase [Pyxidicoccus sp. 3LG]
MEKFRVLLLALAVTGCGAVQEDDSGAAGGTQLAERSSAIVNGTLDYGHPSVGLVYPSGCTGTLVGRWTVLTAAHCVTSQGQSGVFCSNGFCVSGIYSIHPNYTPDGYFNDIAVLRLDSDFQALSGVVPSRIASSAPRSGWQVTIVGFGCTNWDTNAGYGTKRFGYNILHDVDALKVQWDNSTARLCPGDSGGPVFGNADWRIRADCQIGVNSHRQSSGDGADDVATRVDATASWIRSIASDTSIYSCGQTLCGDGTCHSQENNLNCASDCQPVCANGVCESGESGTCVEDCPVCGDGICGASGSENCEADCGFCGNDICEVGDPVGCRDCL